MARVAVAALGLAALSAASARPQTPATPPFQPPPTFSTGTSLVQVDVIVRDRSGRFVGDLSRDDFEVIEDATPQAIMAAYLVTRGDTALPAQPGKGIEVMPLGQRVLVLAFDDEHLSPGGFKRAQDGASEFLSTQFVDGDLGGVVVGGRLVNDRFTTSRKELVDGVRSAKYSNQAQERVLEMRMWPRIASDTEAFRIAQMDDTVLDQAVRRACADDPSACTRSDELVRTQLQNKAKLVDAMRRAASRRFVSTALTLASGLGRFEGRKAVVLFTEGFLVQELENDLKRLVQQAARSGVTFYAVDAQGLGRTNRGRDFTEGAPLDPGGSSTPLAAYESSEDSPNVIANDTGGFVVRYQNNVKEALAEVSRDASHYYVLGYTPSNPALDGSYRQIRVRVKRPGVLVRARAGYVAVAEGPALAGRVRSGAPGSAPAAPAADATSPAARVLPGSPPTALPDSPVGAPTARAEAVPDSATASRLAASDDSWRLRPRGVERKAELTKYSEAATPASTAARAAALELGRQAWQRYEQGDLEAAEPLFQEAVASGVAPPWVGYAYGLTAFALGRFSAAVAAWERVVQAVPEFQGVYFDLADGYLQLKDTDGALKALRTAEKRWPNDPEVLNAIGVLQVTRGTLDAAIDTLTRAYGLAPDYPTTTLNLGKTFELKYVKSSRYVNAMRRWTRDESAREKAIEFYTRYLEKGGPYENAAREGLQRLNWDTKPK